MSIHIAGVEVDRGTIPLWAGVLGSPLLWAVQFQLTYMLVPWCCTHHNRWLIPLIHLVFLLITLACGVLCLGHWRELGMEMPRSQDLNGVFSALNAAGIRVRSMRTQSNRLEELFVRLTGDTKSNDLRPVAAAGAK